MRVIQLTARADADGRLRFDVPDADVVRAGNAEVTREWVLGSGVL